MVVTGLAVLAAFDYKDFLSFCWDEDLVIDNLAGEDALIITKSEYWRSAANYRDWR